MYCLKENTKKTGCLDHDALTDENLLIKYRDFGDRNAFEILVERYERELFNYLRHYLGSTEAAEDVFQSTFFQVHLKSEQFEPDRKFRPWLYRIATNQAIDYQRKNRRHKAVRLNTDSEEDSASGYNIEYLVSNEPEADQKMMESERAEQVRGVLAELPDMYKQALYLVYFQKMKYQEAAETLCIPFGTVKSRLHYAVKKLNEMLAEYV
jgi:RNA polymerase sigma-70 factor (ECF subfamily)